MSKRWQKKQRSANRPKKPTKNPESTDLCIFLYRKNIAQKRKIFNFDKSFTCKGYDMLLINFLMCTKIGKLI